MPTEAQKRRFARLAHDVGCLACKKLGFERPAEMHHPMGRVGENYDKVIPLCEWHHRGVPLLDCAQIRIGGTWNDVGWMLKMVGPSLAHNKPAFYDRFGSLEQLLEEVKELEDDSKP